MHIRNVAACFTFSQKLFGLGAQQGCICWGFDRAQNGWPSQSQKQLLALNRMFYNCLLFTPTYFVPKNLVKMC